MYTIPGDGKTTHTGCRVQSCLCILYRCVELRPDTSKSLYELYHALDRRDELHRPQGETGPDTMLSFLPLLLPADSVLDDPAIHITSTAAHLGRCNHPHSTHGTGGGIQEHRLM